MGMPAGQFPPMPSNPGMPDQAGPPPGENAGAPPMVPEIRLARKAKKSIKRVPKGHHKVRKGGKRKGRKG